MGRWVGAIITGAVLAFFLVAGWSDLHQPPVQEARPGSSISAPTTSSMPAPTAEEESGERELAVSMFAPPAPPTIASLETEEDPTEQSSPQNPPPRHRQRPRREPTPEAPGPSGTAGADHERQGAVVPQPPRPLPSRAESLELENRVERRVEVEGPSEMERSGDQTTQPVEAAPPPLPEARATVLTPPVLVSGSADYPGDAYAVAVDRSRLTPELRLILPEGRVVLRVLVRPDGTVDQVEVAASSGHPELDRAAAEAAQSWQFRPATRDGEPIAAWAVIPVRFVIS